METYQQSQNFRDIAISGEGNSITIHQVVESSISLTHEYELNQNSPYRGLKRFNFRDRDLFFGRDQLIVNLVDAVSKNKLILVLGASGSGKSSVVRAGLLPQLYKFIGSNLLDFTFTPNKDPFESFKKSLNNEERDYDFREDKLELVLSGELSTLKQAIQALKEEGTQWLLFIDQFEELFTTCHDLEKRKKFLEDVVQIAESEDDSVRIVLAMRADFLSQFSSYPNFGKNIQQHIHLVTDMSEDELRLVIEQPAAKHGVAFEEGLVEEIIQDIQSRAGYLPLLQYLLTLLWETEYRNGNLENRTLKLDTYLKLGRVGGALQKRVDEIFKGLNSENQSAAKQIFLRLVNIIASGPDTVAVSRRAYRSEFTGDLVEATLNRFINEKLLVSSSNTEEDQQATVEIAHEILLSSWHKLKEWIRDAKEIIILKNRLVDDVKRWKDLLNKNNLEYQVRAHEELLTGSRLQRIVELRQEEVFTFKFGGLSSEENEFIDASIEWRDCLAKQEEERKQRELEQERKARRAAQGRNRIAFVSLLIMVGLTVLSIRESINAKVRTLEALSASSRALFSSGKELDSLLEALKAGVELKKSSWAGHSIHTQVLTALQQTVYRVREQNRFEGHDAQIWDVASHPNGQFVVSAGGDNTVRLWSIDGTLIKIFGRTEGQTHQSPNEHTDQVFAVKFSPNGQLIASASGDKTIKLWKLDGALLKTFGGVQGHTGEVVSVDFSPDGQLIASASRDGTIRIWRIDGDLVHVLEGHTKAVRDISFSPDGLIFASASFDGTIKLWRLTDGALIRQIPAHSKEVNSVDFSPDGKMIASASDDKTVKIWKLDGQLIYTFQRHVDIVWSVNFSSNGQMLVSSDGSGNVKVWQVDGKEISTLRSNGSPTYSASFVGSEDKTIISSDFNRTITLWEISTRTFQEHKILTGHTDRIWSVKFNETGIASASADNTFKFWGTNGRLVRTFIGHENSVTRVSFNPNGQTVASASLDRTVRLWNLENGNLISTLRGHTDWLWGVSFSPDGQIIASAGNDRTIRLWRPNGSLIKLIDEAHQGWIFDVQFSPNGQMLASASRDKTIKLWRIDGSLVRTLGGIQGHNDVVSSVSFSSDGKLLASSSVDKTVKLWRLGDGKLLATFRGHQGYVIGVSFSPDGQRIASASWDGTVKLWQLDGTLVRTLQGHGDEVNGVSFDPFGKQLASASKDKTVILWQLDSLQNLDLDALITEGCSLLNDYLETNPNVTRSDRHLCDRF